MAEKMVDVNIYRDEAASLLGQYLLKGYKMLSSHCLSCGVSTMIMHVCCDGVASIPFVLMSRLY